MDNIIIGIILKIHFYNDSYQLKRLSLFDFKHRKNCECCPVSLLIVRQKDCYKIRFSIVRIVISVSNVTSLWDCLCHCLCNCLCLCICHCHCIFLVRSCPLITLIKCLKGHKSPGLSFQLSKWQKQL